MKRAPFWIFAVCIAAIAAALTVWLSASPPAETDQSPTTRTSHGRRTGKLVPVRRDAPVVPVEHPRVAALAPGIAQILRDLGCDRLIVGRHSSDDWTDQSVTVCSDQQSIDYERLIAAKPTHVFLQWGERPLPERLTELATEHGWTVVSYPLLTLGEISNAVIAIYGSIGPDELKALRTDEGRPPAQPLVVQRELERAPFALIEKLDRAFAGDPSLAGAGRVLLLYQGAGEGAVSHPAALGPGSYSHDLLLRIGGLSATPSGKQFMPLDAEDIGALYPDAIVIIRPRKAGTPAATPTYDDLVRSLGAAARLDIPAVANRRIALIDDTMALVPGTNLTEFADRLRAILKGWAPEAPETPPVR